MRVWEKAYQEGKQAYECCDDSTTCPYFFDSEEWHAWGAGWFDARELHMNIIYQD